MSVFDPRDRELCVDGACIGLIGPDGHCKECGTPGYSAKLDPRRRGLRDEEEIAEELEQRIIKGDALPPPEGFAERTLCPDGACVGVIGRDGRCKECGAEGTASPSPEYDDGDDDDYEADDDNDYEADGDDDGDDYEGDNDGDEGDNDGDEGDNDHEGDNDGDDDRRLCPDGACIGLIGRDGRCKECGKPGE